MLSLQTDIYSEFDRFMADKFVYAVDQSPNASLRVRDAAEIMRGWDGRMTATSAAPTLAVRCRTELVRLLLEPKLGPAPKDGDSKDSTGTLSWKTYKWGMQSTWLENVVENHPKRWLPPKYSSYDELLADAVEAAVAGSAAPRDLNSWYWGDVNAVAIQHPIFGQIPFLQHWSGPGVQRQSGSGYTVKAVTRSHGPSERITDDLSDLDRSTLNLVTGEAGNFPSPYYMDEWKAWHDNNTFPLAFSKEAVAQARSHQLVLEPGK